MSEMWIIFHFLSMSYSLSNFDYSVKKKLDSTGSIFRNSACDLEQITTVDAQLFLQPQLIFHTEHSQYQILRTVNARY